MADDGYQTWRDMLAGKAPPVHVEKPQPGFWVQRYMGTRTPVAIFARGDSLTAIVGFKADRQMRPALEVWPGCCKWAIAEAAYRAAYESGRWPDDAGAITIVSQGAVEVEESNLVDDDQRSWNNDAEPGAAIDEPAPIGHNNPPAPAASDDKIAGILARLDALDKVAPAVMAAITDQATLDAAANLLARYKQTKALAEEARKAEKKPFDDGAKAVQEKWVPIGNRIALAMGPIQRAADKWSTAEDTRRQDEARAAVIAGAPPAEAKPAPVRAGGATGRVAGLRTFKSAEVTDWPALVDALKGREDFKVFCQGIADAAARSDIALPGCKIVETKRLT